MKKILLGLGTIGVLAIPLVSVIACGDKTDSYKGGDLSSFISKSPNYSYADQPIVAYHLENWVGSDDIKYLKFQYKNGRIGNIKLDNHRGWIDTGNEFPFGAEKYENWSLKTQTERNLSPTLDINLVGSNINVTPDYLASEKRISAAYAKASNDTHATYQSGLEKYAESWSNTKYDPNITTIINSHLYSSKAGYFDQSKNPSDVSVAITPIYKNYPRLDMDYFMDYSKQKLLNNNGYTEKEIILANIGGTAKKYGLIQNNLIPDILSIPEFTFIDWEGKKTIATVFYDEKTKIEKISIDTSESQYFSKLDLEGRQYII